MRHGLAVMCVLVWVCAAWTAQAQGMHSRVIIHDGAPVEGFVDAMAKKFARGIVNTLTGWGEIPRQIAITSADEGALMGGTVGLFKGALMTVVRTGVGVVETGLFFVPAPGYYEPMLDPEFVWQPRMHYAIPDHRSWP